MLYYSKTSKGVPHQAELQGIELAIAPFVRQAERRQQEKPGSQFLRMLTHVAVVVTRQQTLHRATQPVQAKPKADKWLDPLISRISRPVCLIVVKKLPNHGRRTASVHATPKARRNQTTYWRALVPQRNSQMRNEPPAIEHSTTRKACLL